MNAVDELWGMIQELEATIRELRKAILDAPRFDPTGTRSMERQHDGRWIKVGPLLALTKEESVSIDMGDHYCGPACIDGCIMRLTKGE